MINSSGIIVAPVSPDDVASVLDLATHDVKTLCMSLRINMWAKFKPEAVGDHNILHPEVRKNNNFGIEPAVTYQSKSLFIEAVRDGSFTGGWVHKRVGEKNWGRLTDFEGYNHKAIPPFGSLSTHSYILSNSNTQGLKIECAAPHKDTTGDSSGMLSVMDFNDYNNLYRRWYFGILLFSSSRTLMATHNLPIEESENNWVVDFGHIHPSYAGLYRGIPFLSSERFSEGADEINNLRIIGIGINGVEINLQSVADVYITRIDAEYHNQSGTLFDYSVSIRNSTDRAYTFRNLTFKIGPDIRGINGMTVKSFGNVTVEGGQTWKASGQYDSGSVNDRYVQLEYTGSVATNWIMIREKFVSYA